MKLGDEFPNFEAETTVGRIKFHDWLGDSWGILFSHPADFTPVCTTELARILHLHNEFVERNVKAIAVSCDSVADHKAWLDDIKAVAKERNFLIPSTLTNGNADFNNFPYPIIADEQRSLAIQLQMLDPNEKDSDGVALTARAVFVIDPKKKMRLSILYPATTGRNFSEILRAIDSLQLTDKHKVATPVDWQVGEPVMVQPSIPEEELPNLFPEVKVVDVPSGKKYIRQVTLPSARK